MKIKNLFLKILFHLALNSKQIYLIFKYQYVNFYNNFFTIYIIIFKQITKNIKPHDKFTYLTLCVCVYIYILTRKQIFFNMNIMLHFIAYIQI